MLRQAVPMLSLALLIATQAAAVESPDWSRYAEHGVVTVTTTNRDGSPRDTKAWLAVVGGRGYLRTGGTRAPEQPRRRRRRHGGEIRCGSLGRPRS
jgi:hypothetical protein